MFKEICYILTSVVCLSLALPVEDRSWRVVGGTDADPGEFPYQIALIINGRFNCGGSIVSPWTILTAAHCVFSTPSSMRVVAGTNTFNSGGVIYTVEKVVIHEGYGIGGRFNDDIAVLILHEEIQYTDNIQPIEMDDVDNQNVMDVKLSGWGSTFLGSPPSEKLQKLDLKTMSYESCHAIHGKDVTPSMICTLTVAGEGACHGDSGGPLVSRVGKLVGVVSWGSPCARGRPDVYGRVSSFVEWVKTNGVW